VSSYGFLRVGTLKIASYRNTADDELLALFRDDMLQVGSTMASDYYTEQNGFSSAHINAQGPLSDDDEIITYTYRCPGSTMTDRLDLMGATADASLSFLDERLAERIFAADDPTNSRDWIQAIVSNPDNVDQDGIPRAGSKRSLLDNLDCRNYLEERYILRCTLLAFPQEAVTLDITDLNQGGWLDAFPRLETLASGASARIREATTGHAPVVVLTEGRTDAEFLSYAVQILYPHLTDLVRFLDFDQRPEGGAGALVRMARAFAAAGIANRVIAIFDNDTAA